MSAKLEQKGTNALKMLAQTEKSDNGRQMSDIEQNNKNERTAAAVIITILLVGIVVGVIFLRLQRNKLNRLVNDIRQEKLNEHSELLDRMQNESDLSELIQRHIDTMKSLAKLSYAGHDKTLQELLKHSLRFGEDKNVMSKLRRFVDIENHGIISKLKEKYPKLTESDLDIITLMCCDFSRTEISVCMGYASAEYSSVRMNRIARKMSLEGSLKGALDDLIADDCEDEKPSGQVDEWTS